MDIVCWSVEIIEKAIHMEIPPPGSMMEGRRDCRSI